MRMKDSGEVGIRHKLGQRPRERPRNLIAALTQLRRDGLNAERLEDRLFRCGSHYFPAAAQALFIENQLPLGRERPKARNVCVRARGKKESDAVMRGVREMRG